MGFFSKTCAKTHKPVVHDMRGFPELSEIVALFPDGSRLVGHYDGYGRVGGVDLLPDGYDEKPWDAIKFVLVSAYKGEDYKDLGKSRDELAQGHFMDNKFLRHCVAIEGFKSHAEYKKSFKALANW
jgi:hypothetical protein